MYRTRKFIQTYDQTSVEFDVGEVDETKRIRNISSVLYYYSDPENSSRPMTRQVLCLMLVKLLKRKEFVDISSVLFHRSRKFIQTYDQTSAVFDVDEIAEMKRIPTYFWSGYLFFPTYLERLSHEAYFEGCVAHNSLKV